MAIRYKPIEIARLSSENNTSFIAVPAKNDEGYDLIQIKRGNKADFENVKLKEGEPAICLDTRQLYVGGSNGEKILINVNGGSSGDSGGSYDPDYINSLLQAYLTSEEAEKNYVKVEGKVTNENLAEALNVIEFHHGVDVNLANGETFTFKGEGGSSLEVGTKGNIRATPSLTQGSFTSSYSIVDPVTDKFVQSMGFVGEVNPVAKVAAGQIEPSIKVDYLYFGYNQEKDKPIVKITVDGEHVVVGDTDIVEKIHELEQSSELDIATVEEVISVLEDVFV